MKHRDDGGLFDYQVAMKGSLYEAWSEVRSVMCQMPTGTGKTHLLVSVVRDYVRSEGKPVWIVVHRIELVEQISGTLSRYGVPHGRIAGGSPFGSEPVQVVSIQTLSSLMERGKLSFLPDEPPFSSLPVEVPSVVSSNPASVFSAEASSAGSSSPASVFSAEASSAVREGDIPVLVTENPVNPEVADVDMADSPPRTLPSAFRTGSVVPVVPRQVPGLLVIDEAHHAPARSYARLWELFPDAYKLGMTATPCRLSRGGFTALFDRLLTSWSVSRFIEEGRLALFDYLSVLPDSSVQRCVDRLSRRGADGDYSLKEMGFVLDRPDAVERLYDAYHTFASGKKGIIYAINRLHSLHICECYRSHGVRIASIDSRTPAVERRLCVERYAKGEMDVLVNVDIFSEGFDCPSVEFIQLARPTLSLSKYLQQVGRGLRVHPSKVRTVILDHAGLYLRFGLPTDDRDWHGLFLGVRCGKGTKDASRASWLSRQGEQGDSRFSRLEMGVVQGYEDFLREVANRRAEVEPFVEDGLYGLRKGDEVILSPSYVYIAPFVDGYAVVTHSAGRYGIVTGKGRLLALPRCLRIDLYAGGLAYVEESPVLRYYLDLKTFVRYEKKPELFQLDFLEFVYDAGYYSLRMREPRWKTLPVFTRDELKMNGDLFFRGGIFIHRSSPSDVYWHEYTDGAGNLLGSDLRDNLYLCPPGKVPVYYGVKVWMDGIKKWKFVKQEKDKHI